MLHSTVSIQIPIIKLATFLVFQRLYISRHHFGGTLWIPAPQTKAKSHGLHRPTAGGAGEDLPEDSLPRCGDERAAGYVHKPTRGQSPGTDVLWICERGCLKEYSGVPRGLAAPLTFQDSSSVILGWESCQKHRPGGEDKIVRSHTSAKEILNPHTHFLNLGLSEAYTGFHLFFHISLGEILETSTEVYLFIYLQGFSGFLRRAETQVIPAALFHQCQYL